MTSRQGHWSGKPDKKDSQLCGPCGFYWTYSTLPCCSKVAADNTYIVKPGCAPSNFTKTGRCLDIINCYHPNLEL